MIFSVKTATFQLGVKLKKMHWVELKRFINMVKNHRLVFPELMSLGEWKEERREDSGAQMVGVRNRSREDTDVQTPGSAWTRS